MVGAHAATPGGTTPEFQAPEPISTERLQKLLEAQPSGFTQDSAEGGIAFTYGELTFAGVEALLRDAIARRPHGDPPRSFLDLGSGTGRVVLCASALYPALECSLGVELSRRRHASAVAGRDVLHAGAPEARLAERVRFLCGDARSAVVLIAAADVIWVSNTCFPDQLNTEVSRAIAENVGQGAIVYATHPLLLSDRWCGDQPADRVPLACSWSCAHHALAYTLLDAPKWPPAVAEGRGSEEEEDSSAASDEDFVQRLSRRAFARWASRDEDDDERWVLEGEHLAAALASALLWGGVAPRRVLDLLHPSTSPSTVASSSRLLLGGAAAAALAGEAGGLWAEGGVSLEAFEELCGRCWEAASPPPPTPSRRCATGCGLFSLCSQ